MGTSRGTGAGRGPQCRAATGFGFLLVHRTGQDFTKERRGELCWFLITPPPVSLCPGAQWRCSSWFPGPALCPPQTLPALLALGLLLSGTSAYH